jgi:hypothetical protein
MEHDDEGFRGVGESINPQEQHQEDEGIATQGEVGVGVGGVGGVTLSGVAVDSFLQSGGQVLNTRTSNNEYGNYDDDDDTDNWSRMVETDETQPVVPGVEHQNSGDTPSTHSIAHAMIAGMEDGQSPVGGILRPSQPELTMREKLVLRERELRIETKRARLKRHFMLNDNSIEGEENGGGRIGEEGKSSETNNVDDGDGCMECFASGSVATMGEESTVVHLDEDEEKTEPATTSGDNGTFSLEF